MEEKKNSLPEQEAYWDKVAEQKEFTIPVKTDVIEKYLSKEMEVLDIGCGYGRALEELHRVGFRKLTGVDFSQGMIDRGLRQYPFLNLIKSGEGGLPFQDESFQSVILIAVLTCVSESREQEKMIDEILRVLKKGGVLYVGDFLLNQEEVYVNRYKKYEEKYGEYGFLNLLKGQ